MPWLLKHFLPNLYFSSPLPFPTVETFLYSCQSVNCPQECAEPHSSPSSGQRLSWGQAWPYIKGSGSVTAVKYVSPPAATLPSH